jgi:zinc D-Ala-D-Ala carboxypeptidase
MNLSPHFTLDELTHSDTAKREGIPNRPDAGGVAALTALCNTILEPLRAAVGGAIKVNSGYRGPQLNARIGGAGKSQHLVGEAADIQAPAVSVLRLFKTILQLGLPFDQVIYEAKNATTMWVHVSHRAAGNRGEIRIAQFDANGKPTGYPMVSAEQALALPEPARSRSMGPAALPAYVEGDDEPQQRTPAKKAATKKAAVKKAPAKKAVGKKTPAKKVPAKKAAAKKTR